MSCKLSPFYMKFQSQFSGKNYKKNYILVCNQIVMSAEFAHRVVKV